MTIVEAQVALARDHSNGRHVGRRWKGCPVCDWLADPLDSRHGRMVESTNGRGGRAGSPRPN